MKKLLPSISFITCLSLSAFAQNVLIKKVELAGEKVIVHYELDDSNPNHEYQIQLYASKNNFAAPLSKVKGDVGADIKPGQDKKIEWSLRDELGSFKGRLSLEIRGKVYVPIVRLQNFDVNKSYRRGKTYDLAWKPGNNNPINIELFKAGERISGDANQSNNGSYNLFVPAHAKTGKDYQLKITDAKNPDDVVYSGFFKVVPKVPLVVKALPIVVVGALVAVLTGGKKDGTKPPAGDDKIVLPDLPK